MQVLSRGQRIGCVQNDSRTVGVGDVKHVRQVYVAVWRVSYPVDHLGIWVVDECLLVLGGGHDFHRGIGLLRFADLHESHAGSLYGHGVSVIDVYLPAVASCTCEPLGHTRHLPALDVGQLLHECLFCPSDDCRRGDHQGRRASRDDVAVVGVCQLCDDAAAGSLQVLNVYEVLGRDSHRSERLLGYQRAAHHGVMTGGVDELANS